MELKETEIEVLRQIVSRTDKSGNENVLLLIDFIKRSVKPIGLVQPMGYKRQSELALRKNVLANSIRRCFTDGTNKVTIRPEHILVPIVLTKCGRV